MPLFCHAPFASIFLLMVTAILLSVCRDGAFSCRVTLAAALAAAALSAFFLSQIGAEGRAAVFTLGKFPAPFGNELKFGPLQGLMALCFCGVSFLSLLGGRRELLEEVPSHRVSLACVMLNMMLASLLALVYTNDLFTAYVFLEISTISACALAVVQESRPSLIATVRYLFVSLLGSGLFLLGTVLLYSITGHLLMPQLKTAVSQLAEQGAYLLPLLMSLALITAGLGIKGAMFPFHRWLPPAHSSAATSASAVLSGLVLKGYALLLITLLYRVFPMETFSRTAVCEALYVLGLLGMLAGSLRAVGQSSIKEMLAYSSVAQMGYVFMGIGLGTPAGMAAVCFQILVHACSKPLLFLCAGRLSAVSGRRKEFSALRGSAWRAPAAGVGFGVGALSMIGIPIFAGFGAKLSFAAASLDDLSKAMPTLLMLGLSSVLNALYYLPALITIWNPQPERGPRAEPDRAFSAAALVLMAGVVSLGIWFGPVMRLITLGLERM